MTEFRRKDIKRLIDIGTARDVSNISHEEMMKITRGGITRLGYCYGVSGCSGAVFVSDTDGTMYAVLGRVSNLWLVM